MTQIGVYSDLAINRLDWLTEQEQANDFEKLFSLDATGTIVLYYGRAIKTDLIKCFYS